MSRIVTTSRKGKSTAFRLLAEMATALLLVAICFAILNNCAGKSDFETISDEATRDSGGHNCTGDRKTNETEVFASGEKGNDHPEPFRGASQAAIDSHAVDIEPPAAAAVEEYTGIRSMDTNAPAQFSNPIETILGMALSADDDSAIPPLPISGDDPTLNDQLRAALTTDIVIYDTDDASVVAFKERVADFKAQLKDVLDNGGDVAKALLEYQNFINEGARVRNEVVLKHMQLQKETTEEEARDFLEVANQALESEGISPITEDKSPRRRGSRTIQE